MESKNLLKSILYIDTQELTPCEKKEVVKYEWFSIKGDFETEDLTSEEK